MVAEFVCFIHQYEVEIICIPVVIVVGVENLAQTAIGNKLRVFINAEIPKRGFPVLFDSRRIYHQNLCVVTSILYQELFGYHGGNHSFSKTHHICQEEAIIAKQFLIALYHSIHLILIFVIALWHVEGVIHINSQHSVTEKLHQHLHV